MKRTLGLILAAVLLGGCSPSSQIVDVTDVQYEPAGPTPQAEALPTPSPTPGPYVTEDIFVVECEDGINLRESSSSKSDLIGTLLPGDRVKVLGYQSQRFARVQLDNGQIGYAIAGYLKVEDYAAFGLEVVQPVEKYSYEQMLQDLDALAAQYPSLCFLESAGQSLEGRELQVIVIGDVEAPHHVGFCSRAGRRRCASISCP